jgi:hypothetical protein
MITQTCANNKLPARRGSTSGLWIRILAGRVAAVLSRIIRRTVTDSRHEHCFEN